MDDIVNVALILLLKRGIHLGTSGSFDLTQDKNYVQTPLPHIVTRM